MLAELTARFGEGPTLGNTAAVRTWLGPIEELPPHQGRADAIFMNAVFGNLDNPASVLWRSCTLLNPGGRLVISHPEGTACVLLCLPYGASVHDDALAFISVLFEVLMSEALGPRHALTSISTQAADEPPRSASPCSMRHSMMRHHHKEHHGLFPTSTRGVEARHGISDRGHCLRPNENSCTSHVGHSQPAVPTRSV